MHAAHFESSFSGFVLERLVCRCDEVVAANVFDAVLVLITFTLSRVSAFTLEDVDFIRSWASALSLSHSLKSINVGLSNARFTVCSDHASFILGGSFCSAWPSSEALHRS